MEKGDNDLEVIIDSLTERVKELEEINKGSAYRIADLENINEGRRQLNGQLRVEIKMWKDLASELEKTKNLLHGYKAVIEDLSSQLRKAGK